MKRWMLILALLFGAIWCFAQVETHVVDSLLVVLDDQEGREKVKTMLELTWDFYDVSFDDCITWGERALAEAELLNEEDLVAEANYTLGIQYAQHNDLDLAKHYLQRAYNQYIAIDDSKFIQENGWDFSSTKYAYLSLNNLATYELVLGSIDTAYIMFEDALALAKQMNDTAAIADVVSNMGLIWYRRNNQEMSFRYYNKAIVLYEAISDDLYVYHMKSNLAVLFMERGFYDKARHIYWDILPQFEAYGDSYYAFLACKNLGIIYENALVNYDSALFYFQKAINYCGKPTSFQENELFLNKELSGALVEMGNVMERQGNQTEAVLKYEEALDLAETNSYLFGQMDACVSLGKIYSKMGQSHKSLRYFQRYFELEKLSGMIQLRPSFRKALSLDYAHLGYFEELSIELDQFDEEIQTLKRETNDLYDQISVLQDETQDLLAQYESQNEQIQTLQSQRNHYRLAFFGLLAIALFALVLLVAYKIVRKKRAPV